ncbi:glucose-1-phosphate thymidylyltransferase [Actinomadura sp. 1N219]|uniref:glucose-1-phosphate thymidylyltransferase n=1 Tax=Actinomadura sp. 1N219 TaxID=3375152 RepID=UPI0037B71550
MKALVLAGGSGTRLRPVSHSLPKQLIPVANIPILEHVLRNIRDLGVTEIAVVVGDSAAEINREIGDGSRLGARITYLHQAEPLGLAHCVRLAGGFLGDDDFVMYLGDNFLPDGIVAEARRFTAERPAAQVVTHRVDDPRRFGVVELDHDGSILRLTEKPAHPRSDFALIGVYFFTAAIHRAVAAIAPSARGELEITDAVQWLVTEGAHVTAMEYTGYWKDIGRAEDVLAGNLWLLRKLRPNIAGEVDAASVVSGPVVVDPGARVVRSRIEGPVIIGSGTLIEDSRIGPGTSIGRDCTLRATRLADSVVLDGASISDVPGLSGSLIGRRATVTRNVRSNSSHGLVVGDHCRIEVPVSSSWTEAARLHSLVPRTRRPGSVLDDGVIMSRHSGGRKVGNE